MSKETVLAQCKADCIYRKTLAGGQACCMYAAIEHKPRGCKISECDKYKRGRRVRPRLSIATEIWWEYVTDEVDE